VTIILGSIHIKKPKGRDGLNDQTGPFIFSTRDFWSWCLF
ncbi:unnamed protein product, partial [Acidithrix sp. C25]